VIGFLLSCSRGSSLGAFGRRDGWRTTWQVKRDKNRERFVHSKSVDRRVMSLLRSPPFPFRPPAHPPDKVFHFPHLWLPRGSNPLAGLAPRLSSSPILPLNYGSQISWALVVIPSQRYVRVHIRVYTRIHTVFHKYMSADMRSPDISKFACSYQRFLIALFFSLSLYRLLIYFLWKKENMLYFLLI